MSLLDPRGKAERGEAERGEAERGEPAVSSPDFWQDLYARGEDGWELGAPAPPLVAWLDRGGRIPIAGGAPAPPRAHGALAAPRVAVLGCGRGHDARLLARAGYAVWGFDFAATAVADARARARREGIPITVEQRDLFGLDADCPGFFDAAWEYTCFCAIHPGRREEYARLVHAILKPGGWFLACFYPLREGAEGPPFPVSVDGIERVLAPGFTIVEAGPPAESAEGRRGLEWFVRAERR